jgi:hypothetical protein
MTGDIHDNYNILFIAILSIESLGDDEIFMSRQIAHEAMSEILGEDEDEWEVVFTPDCKLDAKIIPFPVREEE